MAKVALLIDSTVDPSAASAVEERLRVGGHDVIRVGHGADVPEVDDVRADDFDAVVVPPMRKNHLRTHERYLNFLRDAYARGRLVAVMYGERWIGAPAGSGRGTWPAVKRELVVEPSGALAADPFGTLPLVTGAGVESLAGLLGSQSTDRRA